MTDYIMMELSQNVQELTRRLDSMEGVIDHIAHTLDEVTTILKNHLDQLSDIRNEIYELAPDKEVIDTMADSEEERKAMIDKYMNHREDWG